MRSQLLQKHLLSGNKCIIEEDIHGEFHFNGNFRNAGDLKAALDALPSSVDKKLLAKEEKIILQTFEKVFNHKAFTGRSGTFFGYEGLGSIYWHMVSKYLLAVEECCLKAIEANEDAKTLGGLLEHFYEINEGIGVHKAPELYGAFPTDPYSHTPMGKGAQQPGMTGQVKEDILSRMGELGIKVKEGKVQFNPGLLRANEFCLESGLFNYVNTDGHFKTVPVLENTLVFTYCQVPVIYHLAEVPFIVVEFKNRESVTFEGLSLDKQCSKDLFSRNGEIEKIKVFITKSQLK
jgi:hypothetical protein